MHAVASVALIFAFTVAEICAESLPPLKTGPAIGSDVTSFYVRAVTGPLAGKSVCYVCRNGDRPVVVVFLRDLNADTTRLLKQLDRTVNEHRADGLRCFVVLLSESPQKDAARLQTLAFDEKLDLPLTVAGEAMTLANLASDASIAVVMYENLKVRGNFCYRTGECTETACKTVIDAAKVLAVPHTESREPM